MPALGQVTMVSPLLAAALAVPTMLVIAWHVLGLQHAPMEPLRRRVRMANGLLMMFIAALLAYAIGMMPVPDAPHSPAAAARAFVMVWTAIVGLLFVVVALAVADAMITTRAGFRAHRAMRREMSANFGGSPPRGDASRV